MDQLLLWQEGPGRWKAGQLLLLLCLAGRLEAAILGPDYVIVNVPCSFECKSNCPSSSCTYSLAVDGQRSLGKGNVLALTLEQWMDSLNLTCTVMDEGQQGPVVTVTKNLQVLAGPTNISITGSDMINPKVSHSYSCHAYCRPSCNYTWKMNDGPWIGGQGNVIGVTPGELDPSKALICKAVNSVSGLWVAKMRYITVVSGPSDVHINGPDSIKMYRKHKFTCVANCAPSCRYLWSGNDQTLIGSEIEVEVEYQLKSLTLRCEAQNIVSGKSATASKNLRLQDHSTAARAKKTMALLTCALILAAVIPA